MNVALAMGGAIVVAASSMVALSSVSGCQGHQCDPTTVEYGRAVDGGPSSTEGEMLTPNIWVSTRFASLQPEAGPRTWLPFPHARTWIMHPVPLNGREITRVSAFISPDQMPNNFGSNFTQGGGSLSEFTIIGSDVFVTNATCADYFVQVSIEALPAVDAGADATDGATDASDAGD